jgi:hypothetical protein
MCHHHSNFTWGGMSRLCQGPRRALWVRNEGTPSIKERNPRFQLWPCGKPWKVPDSSMFSVATPFTSPPPQGVLEMWLEQTEVHRKYGYSYYQEPRTGLWGMRGHTPSMESSPTECISTPVVSPGKPWTSRSPMVTLTNPLTPLPPKGSLGVWGERTEVRTGQGSRLRQEPKPGP